MPYSDPAAKRAYDRQYAKTAKFRAAQRRYRTTARGRAVHRASCRQHAASEKGRASRQAYQALLARFQKFLVLQQYSRSIVPFCACCGEKYPEFLALDHFGAAGRRLRKQVLGTGTPFYRRIIKARFPRGLRVLCANCNTATRLGRVCPHRQGR